MLGIYAVAFGFSDTNLHHGIRFEKVIPYSEENHQALSGLMEIIHQFFDYNEGNVVIDLSKVEADLDALYLELESAGQIAVAEFIQKAIDLGANTLKTAFICIQELSDRSSKIGEALERELFPTEKADALTALERNGE